jgi:hypothetical protein
MSDLAHVFQKASESRTGAATPVVGDVRFFREKGAGGASGDEPRGG